MPIWWECETCTAAQKAPKGLVRATKSMHTPIATGTQARRPAESPALAVDARGVSLTFQTSDGLVEALSKVDLQIAAGEFVSFIGAVRLRQDDFAAGHRRTSSSPGRRRHRQRRDPGEGPRQTALSLSLPGAGLFPWRTIERNVMLPLEIMGFSGRGAEGAAARCLALVELSGFEHKFPWRFSGGMQQRASIARRSPSTPTSC